MKQLFALVALFTTLASPSYGASPETRTRVMLCTDRTYAVERYYEGEWVGVEPCGLSLKVARIYRELYIEEDYSNDELKRLEKLSVPLMPLWPVE